MFCYWPKYNISQKARKGEIPDKEQWKKYAVRIFSYTGTYDRSIFKMYILNTYSLHSYFFNRTDNM